MCQCSWVCTYEVGSQRGAGSGGRRHAGVPRTAEGVALRTAVGKRAEVRHEGVGRRRGPDSGVRRRREGGTLRVGGAWEARRSAADTCTA